MSTVQRMASFPQATSVVPHKLELVKFLLLIKRDHKNTRAPNDPNLSFALKRNVSAMHCLKPQASRLDRKLEYLCQWSRGEKKHGFDFVIYHTPFQRFNS
jgi:hypothetical protein